MSEVVYVKNKAGVKDSLKTFSVMGPSGNRYSFYENKFIAVNKNFYGDVKFFENNVDYEVKDSLEKLVEDVKEKVEEIVKPKKKELKKK